MRGPSITPVIIRLAVGGFVGGFVGGGYDVYMDQLERKVSVTCVQIIK